MREPGVNPGLPRSGQRERPPPDALVPGGTGKRRTVGNRPRAGLLASPKTCQHAVVASGPGRVVLIA